MAQETRVAYGEKLAELIVKNPNIVVLDADLTKSTKTIEAKKACPERQVTALCGDGSLQMQFMELATAVQHDIDIKLIVFVNNMLGMVRELQDRVYEREIAVDLTGSPRFDIIAEAYGIKAENITDISQAETAIENMLASEKPYLLQVFVDREERTII